MDKKQYINMELHSLANMTMRYMDSNSHKKLVDSITGTNGWILGFIAHNEKNGKEVFQKDLEETFGITRSTVSKVINLMVQKGLIERSAVEYDARLKKLSLTEKSRELLQYMQEDNEKMEAVLVDGFSNKEKEEISVYIERMKDNLRRNFNENNIPLCKPIKESRRNNND